MSGAEKKKDTSKYSSEMTRRWQDPEYRALMKKRLSAGQKRRFKDPKERKRCYEAGIKKWQREHPAEFRAQQSAISTGVKRPKQTRFMRKRWATKKWSRHYLGVIGHNVQPEWTDRRGCVWRFKSTWELQFAKWLDSHVLSWRYEGHGITLSNGRHYFPDFWVEEWSVHVEIKAGHRDSVKMWQALREGHPILLLQGRAVARFYRWIASQ